MSFSFVIPACNAAGTIGDTLASVSAQTVREWEAIVVDDGSEDGTGEVARRFGDGRVRVVRQENRGLAGARNRGLAEARGEVACFLDADDVVDGRYVEVMRGALGDADLAACGCRWVGEGLEALGLVDVPGAQDCELARLAGMNRFAVGAVVMRRDAPVRLGLGAALFDESLRVLEDWDAWVRLTAAGARWGEIIGEALFSYRVRRGSMSGDIGLMWRAGVGLIERGPLRGMERERAIRRWSVLWLVRAAAGGDIGVVEDVIGRLGALTEEDAAVARGMVWGALVRADGVGIEEARERAQAWRERIGGVLGTRFADMVDEGVRWDDVAAGVLAMSRGRVVVYGMGRNGRALMEALRGRGNVAWIDDHAEARGEGERIGVGDLGTGDVVVVTPDERGGILERLGGCGARVVCVEDVARVA